MVRSRRTTLTEAAIIVVGAGAAVAVGADGDPVWQVLRTLAVLTATAGAIVAVRRSGPAGTAVAGTVAGWVGLGLGLGLGLPWLVDGETTARSLSAVFAFAAGLFLVVVAGLAVGSVTHGWARLVLLPWFAVVAVATFSLSIAIAATNVAPSDLADASPSDRGLDYEDVELVTADGVRLGGWYIPSGNGAAVVVRHGAGSTRTAALGQAAVLADNGYGVLLVDARGHGHSGGRAMDLGWYGELDTTAAVDHLVDRPDVDGERIAVLGLSMGGEEAIGAASADGRIAAVVAEGATGRTAADKAWLSEEYGVTGVLQEQVDRVTYGLVDLFTDASPPATLFEAVADAAPTPFLVIAAGDVPTEAQVAERLAAAAPGTVDVWVVPGAGHTDGLRVAPDEWEDRVITFLDSALAADG